MQQDRDAKNCCSPSNLSRNCFVVSKRMVTTLKFKHRITGIIRCRKGTDTTLNADSLHHFFAMEASFCEKIIRHLKTWFVLDKVWITAVEGTQRWDYRAEVICGAVRGMVSGLSCCDRGCIGSGIDRRCIVRCVGC